MNCLCDKTLHVDLDDRSYDIVVGQGLLSRCAHLMQPFLVSPRLIIVTDENVAKHHLKTLTDHLDEEGISHTSFVYPAGEASKSYSTLEDLTQRILAQGVNRQTHLVALGGGVIGDLVGFAASIVLRGLNFFQIPTSLLAQVDSSVGGKTGINTPQGKNLIGSFHQPKKVIIDTQTLRTLDQDNIRAGYGEIIKYALIDDLPFFQWLQKHGQDVIALNPQALQHAILTSCGKKADIVGKDEKESHDRMLLNLGHTFAHAFEAQDRYQGNILHGQAVCVGLVAAMSLSVQLQMSQPQDLSLLKDHLSQLGLPTHVDDLGGGHQWHGETLLEYMKYDKKIEDHKLTFILNKGIGQSTIKRGINPDDVVSFLKSFISHHLS